MCLSFLDRSGFNDSFEGARVEQVLEEIKREWIRYDTYYNPSGEKTEFYTPLPDKDEKQKEKTH